MGTTKRVRRTFRLDPELDDMLQAKAQQLDRSASWIVTRALDACLRGDGDGRTLDRAAIFDKPLAFGGDQR